MENTEDRAGATSEQQDNVINTVNSLDPYGPSWQLVPGNVAAGTVYAQVPTSGTGDLAFTRASTKTRTNAAGNVVDVASGVAAIDYRNADGSLSSTGRLLLEPQRTNSIRNSTMVGAVAGTPGTLPTNWGSGTGGLTQTVVGIGTENGLQYIDLRFNGIANNVQLLVSFEGSAQIAAANSQTWTESFYAKTISAPNSPVSYRYFIVQRSSAGANVGSFDAAFTPTSTLARYSYTVTTNQATTAFIQPYFYAFLTSGQTYDFTIRIAAPQMELGAYATTFIPTTTAAVTRLADNAIKQNANFLPTGYPFTLFAEMHITNTIYNNSITFLDSASASSYFQIEQIGNIWYAVCRPNTTVVTAAATVPTNIGTHKVAAVFTSSTIKLFLNGSLIATAANNQTFNSNINDLLLGQLRIVSDTLARTPIAQAAVFNRELTNAELAAITTL